MKGALTLSQKANGVGQASAPVNEAHIGASCQYWNKSANYPCKGGPDNVYARTLDANVPALTPPTADWPAWYLMDTKLLVIVADGHGGQVPSGDSIQLVSAVFEGALYWTSAIENDTTSAVIGSTVILGQSVTTSFPTIRIVPNGMPSLQKTIYAQPSPPAGYSG